MYPSAAIGTEPNDSYQRGGIESRTWLLLRWSDSFRSALEARRSCVRCETTSRGRLYRKTLGLEIAKEPLLSPSTISCCVSQSISSCLFKWRRDKDRCVVCACPCHAVCLSVISDWLMHYLSVHCDLSLSPSACLRQYLSSLSIQIKFLSFFVPPTANSFKHR